MEWTLSLDLETFQAFAVQSTTKRLALRMIYPSRCAETVYTHSRTL